LANPLDRVITVTTFPDEWAKRKAEHRISLRRLAPKIQARFAPIKERLPWLKLATLGEVRTDKRCLRHDPNVLAIDGIEGDYDAGSVTIDQACDLLKHAGIAGVVYASPRHGILGNRWRVLCPLSESHPPASRAGLVARLNGALGGILAPESFTLSQSYYYGRVGENPHHRVELVEGRYIDLAGDLEAGAIGRDGPANPTKGKQGNDDSDDDCLREEPDWTRIKSALTAIPADAWGDREKTWRPIGAALHQADGGSEEAYAVWDEFSQASDKYDGADQRRVWDSFGRYAGKPVTLGTLFHIAKGYGWETLQESESGAPLPNLANALTRLRGDPRLAGILAHDGMQQAPVLLKPIPRFNHGEDPDRAKFRRRRLRDEDVTALQEYLQRSGLKRIGKDVTHDAAALHAREQSFHPVRDYLKSLKWDGKFRVGQWLADYLGVELNPYSQRIGRMFLTAMVARILQPGCKADYMLVLEGPQGRGKSTACAILGGEWYSDSLPNLKEGKDVSQHLPGKWLIEIGEMSALSKVENSRLKEFITRQTEKYRRSYGRLEVEEPRQCVFIGTTNRETYLRDETGGRRFWPVRCGDINLDGLKRDRDQLFAEAMIGYELGDSWWPDRQFEAEFIKPEQEARFETDAWETEIEGWLDQSARPRVTVAEVAMHALLFKEAARIGTTDQRRIAACLANLGWVQGKRTGTGRWWVKA